MKNAYRVFCLAFSALICAFATGFIALYAIVKPLPVADLAYGMSVWELLRDPFVLFGLILFALAGAIPGFVFSLWALWKVSLAKAIPVVTMVTGAAAAVSVLILNLTPLFILLIALIAGIVAMFWCHGRTSWEIKDR